MERVKLAKFSLRKFVANSDEAPLFHSLGHPRVARHMATEGISLVDCKNIVSESLEHWGMHKIGSWAVEVNERIVGWAGFKQWKKDEFEILIVLGPSEWGLGKFIFEKLLEMARDEFNLDRIFVLLPETRKTYGFMKRAGFEPAGKENFNGKPFHKFVLDFKFEN